MPWSMPRRNASRAGARPCQRDATNANGVWHCSRQRYLSALNWNSPAAGEHRGAGDPAVEREPRNCAPPIHASAGVEPRAPRRRTRTTRRRSRRSRAPTSRVPSGRPRVIARNRPSSGYVVGSIIAAIISTHASACRTQRHDDRAARNRAAQLAERARIEPAAVIDVARVRARRSTAHSTPHAATASAAEQHRQQRRCARRSARVAPSASRTRRHRRSARRRYASNTNVLCSALWPLMLMSLPRPA